MNPLFQTVEIQIGKPESKRGYPVRLTVDHDRHFSGGYLPPDIAENWTPKAKPQDDGAWLFAQLFTAEQQNQWATIRGQQARRQIRLRIDTAAPELHALPWELLYDVTPGLQPTQPLTMQAETPFSRYWESQHDRVRPLIGPLRLLLVVANPAGLDRYNPPLPPLDVAVERALLESALADLINQKQVELTVLAEDVTLERLDEALQAEQPYHMLHVVAHGQYSQRREQAALLLADPFDGQARPVTDVQICAMLSNLVELPRFIFLSSCHTARRSPTDARQGLAPRLMATGIPAVLAMQDAVPIATARRFSQVFYPQLFRHGLLDLATNQARAALVTANHVDRHLPVLFSRVPENRLLLTEQDALGNISLTAAEYQRQSFAERYRRTVADHLDKVQLFGLDDQYLGKHAPQRRYPLSVAYIPLRLDSAQAEAQERASHEEDARQQAIKQLLDQATPTEKALFYNQSGRLFIQGEAGSGKTTLLSWIAVQVARRQLSDFLQPWNEMVPFFLRLRRCYKQLPLPLDEFLEVVEWRDIPAACELPHPAWVQQQLQAGQGLILVDGFDEVPAAQHDKVISWLAAMVEAYPNNRYLVTSRPLHQAATGRKSNDNPLQDLGFEFARLTPMDADEINALIEHWHAAVKVQLESRADAQAQRLLAQLPTLETELIAQIKAAPRLKELAETPLLCAMLCARHRDKEGKLPTNRIQLYKESIRMLLGNRDRERGVDRPDVSHPDYPFLQEAEKLGCLQEVAYWMMAEGQSEIEWPLLTEKITWRLRQYHHLPPSLEAPQMLAFYVERSSLLRPVGVARYIFAHRTFQEYLAALEFKGRREMNALLWRSSDSEWYETISLFVNLVEPYEANQALQQLVSMVAEADPKRQRQQYLLVLACLREHAQPLDTPTQAALGTAIQGLLPPQSELEATRVAYGQHLALPYLASQAHYNAQEAAYCVQILGQIGGQEAFDMLKGYAPDQRDKVQQALLAAWDSFEQNRFAQEILTVNFSGQKMLYYNSKLSSLEGMQHLPWLHTLDLRDTQVSDLSPLQALPNLQALYLIDTQVSDLSPLQALPNLQALNLWDTQVSDLSPLQALPNLQELTLMNTQVSDLSPLQALPNLQALSLMNTQVSDLSPLQALPNLQALDLSGTQVSDLSPLQALTNLQSLYLWNTQVSDLSPLQALPNLQSLDLRNTQVSDLSPLQALPNLQELTLMNTQVSDLSPLQTLPNLQSLDLMNTQVSDLSPLQTLPNLQSLDLRNTQVSDLSPLQALTNLQRIRLDITKIANPSVFNQFSSQPLLDLKNEQPADISFLFQIPQLQKLGLDITKISDLSPLQALTNLQSLDLNFTQVSDLSPLQALTNLQSLDLNFTQVSDLSPLQALTNLQYLFLRSTQVSDLSPLQALPNLQSLDLSFTQVSDLSPLQALTNLQKLDLTRTQVSDLSPLQALTNLQSLDLNFTQVSDLSPLQALTNLQKLDLPGCHQLETLRPLQALSALRELGLRHVRHDEALLAEMPAAWFAQVTVKQGW